MDKMMKLTAIEQNNQWVIEKNPEIFNNLMELPVSELLALLEVHSQRGEQLMHDVNKVTFDGGMDNPKHSKIKDAYYKMGQKGALIRLAIDRKYDNVFQEITY